MTKEKALEIARKFFGIHPGVSHFHITSNGTAFFKKSDARSHAISLSDKEVHSISREEALSEAQAADTGEDGEKDANTGDAAVKPGDDDSKGEKESDEAKPDEDADPDKKKEAATEKPESDPEPAKVTSVAQLYGKDPSDPPELEPR